jgi:hypothetical protein
MKKCSYCGRDNTDEAVNCHECGTEFATEQEAINYDELVSLGTYGHYESAQIAAALLESNGFDCFMNADDCGGMMTIFGSGIKLFVRPTEIEEAKRILHSQQPPQRPNDDELIVRDLPKPVIVAGIWLLYGTGLISNIIVCIFCLSGTFVGIQGLVFFWLSIGLGSLCAYLMYRVVKNYQIQKRREHTD